MREIKFRGLRTDGGGWVYGLLRKQRQRDLTQQGVGVAYTGQYEYWIDSHEGNQGSWLIIPETLGQFTGLKDKNRTDIYEGDILEHYNSTFNRAEVKKVIFGWYCTDNDGRCPENVMGWVDEYGFPIDTKENEYTIIGSIHEQK